jgi:hypothetical protein
VNKNVFNKEIMHTVLRRNLHHVKHKNLLLTSERQENTVRVRGQLKVLGKLVQPRVHGGVLGRWVLPDLHFLAHALDAPSFVLASVIQSVFTDIVEVKEVITTNRQQLTGQRRLVAVSGDPNKKVINSVLNISGTTQNLLRKNEPRYC